MERHLLLSEAYKIMHEIKSAHFDIKSPVYIKVSICKKFCKRYAAMWALKEYDGFPIHEIKISFVMLSDKKYLTETLAHELVHCEQWENGKVDTPHSRAFFSRLDYVLHQLGLPPTEKEYRKAIKKY